MAVRSLFGLRPCRIRFWIYHGQSLPYPELYQADAVSAPLGIATTFRGPPVQELFGRRGPWDRRVRAEGYRELPASKKAAEQMARPPSITALPIMSEPEFVLA
jgi:hypothetical protein